MPTKRRTYNTRLIRKQNTYTVNEIAERFLIHKNAVRNWLKEGLPTIDDKRPLMIHGSDLAAFLDARQKRRKRPCAVDEFYCCKCRTPRQVWERVVDLTQLKKGEWLARGICVVCESKTQRLYPTRSLPELRERFCVQTVSGEHISGSFHPPVICDFNQGV
ncbi:MAG: helix-turn-helix domain-containing protein [Alphaproteobacteria bacterium]|nr:helix-turn-helix domain-containing protein [Alphaproteobacteria bacterium]